MHIQIATTDNRVVKIDPARITTFDRLDDGDFFNLIVTDEHGIPISFVIDDIEARRLAWHRLHYHCF